MDKRVHKFSCGEKLVTNDQRALKFVASAVHWNQCAGDWEYIGVIKKFGEQENYHTAFLEDSLRRYLPVLHMTVEHQKLILEGKKVQTFRTKRLKPGIYRMENNLGESLGNVEIVKAYEVAVTWTGLTHYQKQADVKREGYDDIADFERAVRRLGRIASFLTGGKYMYRHSIKPVAQ